MGGAVRSKRATLCKMCDEENGGELEGCPTSPATFRSLKPHHWAFFRALQLHSKLATGVLNKPQISNWVEELKNDMIDLRRGNQAFCTTSSSSSACWEVRTAGSTTAKQKEARKSPLLNPLCRRLNLESDLGPQLDSARSPGELRFVQETVTSGANIRVGGAQRIVDRVDERHPLPR